LNAWLSQAAPAPQQPPELLLLSRWVRSVERHEPAPPQWPEPWTTAFGAHISQANLDSLAREVVHAYEGNARIVQELGRARGFRPLFYWQPSVFMKDSLTDREKNRADQQQELLRWFVLAVHAAVGKSAFLRDSVAFRNLDLTFAEDRGEIFWDWCHVSEEANARLADEIYVDILRVAGTKAGGGARAPAGSRSRAARE